jgi:hypothetical protein
LLNPNKMKDLSADDRYIIDYCNDMQRSFLSKTVKSFEQAITLYKESQ